jgi:SulP family sulfate permease
VGVLSSGLLNGVLIGAAISLVLLMRRASRPHVARLGRIPGSRRFSDHDRHTDNERVQGAMIFRPESGLLYFNMDHVRDSVLARVRSESPPPRVVVLDLSATPHVDMHGAHMLAGLAKELEEDGVRTQVVEARASVRDRLRAEGVAEALGGVNRFTTVADAIDSISSEPSPASGTHRKH